MLGRCSCSPLAVSEGLDAVWSGHVGDTDMWVCSRWGHFTCGSTVCAATLHVGLQLVGVTLHASLQLVGFTLHVGLQSVGHFGVVTFISLFATRLLLMIGGSGQLKDLPLIGGGGQLKYLPLIGGGGQLKYLPLIGGGGQLKYLSSLIVRAALCVCVCEREREVLVFLTLCKRLYHITVTHTVCTSEMYCNVICHITYVLDIQLCFCSAITCTFM